MGAEVARIIISRATELRGIVVLLAKPIDNWINFVCSSINSLEIFLNFSFPQG